MVVDPKCPHPKVFIRKDQLFQLLSTWYRSEMSLRLVKQQLAALEDKPAADAPEPSHQGGKHRTRKLSKKNSSKKGAKPLKEQLQPQARIRKRNLALLAAAEQTDGREALLAQVCCALAGVRRDA